jgi:hypothetical protein
MYADPSKIFISPYNNEFINFFVNNPLYELDTINKLWPSSEIPSAVLVQAIIQSINLNPADSLKLALKDNNLYDWAPKTPMHLCYCDADEQVPYQNSIVAYNSFIKNGSSSTSIKLVMPLHGGTHETCAVPSLMDAIAWFDSLKQ